MSAGHGPALTRIGEREYDRALRDPRLQAALAQGFSVSSDYDVPYLGGYSQDGRTIYLDRDIPPRIKRGNRVYDMSRLAGGIITHEHWEKSVLTAWRRSYADAHELATHAEHVYVRNRLQMDPAEYEEVWLPVIKMAEKKLDAQAAQLPPDLDPTPYQS